MPYSGSEHSAPTVASTADLEGAGAIMSIKLWKGLYFGKQRDARCRQCASYALPYTWFGWVKVKSMLISSDPWDNVAEHYVGLLWNLQAQQCWCMVQLKLSCFAEGECHPHMLLFWLDFLGQYGHRTKPKRLTAIPTAMRGLYINLSQPVRRKNFIVTAGPMPNEL